MTDAVACKHLRTGRLGGYCVLSHKATDCVGLVRTRCECATLRAAYDARRPGAPTSVIVAAARRSS